MVHFIPTSERRRLQQAAQDDQAPCLVCGSSGTGKGFIAKWIHDNSPRSTKSHLIAKKEIPLASQIADATGGTLEIPEISEWPLREQKTLLDYLKNRSIPHPQNPSMPLIVNTRIVCTATETIESRAKGGLFNQELYDRLKTLRIDMPPLVKRLDEFEDIVDGIRREIAQEIHKEHVRSISQEAWDKLRTYDWPGNLRELRNVLRLALLKTVTETIEMGDLPDFGHDRIDFRSTRAEFERIFLLELVRTCDSDIKRMAASTKMDERSMRKKLDEHNIVLVKK